MKMCLLTTIRKTFPYKLFLLVVFTILCLQYYLSIPSSFTESIKPMQDYLDKVKNITKCLDRPVEFAKKQRGPYWVLNNYVSAEKTFKCHESITYTSHGDYTFLDNVLEVVRRWQGPISLALFTPGDDFESTLDSIGYLRECTDSLIKDYVTFHVFFPTKHMPKQVPRQSRLFTVPHNCSLPPPYLNVTPGKIYKNRKKLLYPVNVGRNVAREAAQTHYILPSDIELYPSPNIIPQFLQMISENEGPLLSKNPKVFPLHLFEIDAKEPIPETKTDLQGMLAAGTAVAFHKELCSRCHNVPMAQEWQMDKKTEGLGVFHVGKRIDTFIHWEPIFIGTHAEPLYEERLSWEGKSDKMTQGYALCVLDYDFLILDNAFLIHRPGIKQPMTDPKRRTIIRQTNKLIKQVIVPQLEVMYGVKKGCRL